RVSFWAPASRAPPCCVSPTWRPMPTCSGGRGTPPAHCSTTTLRGPTSTSPAGSVARPNTSKPRQGVIIRLMTLTELKYIVAVARERHFGKAAEACFVSQPTLSVAIKKLEEELELKIFERNASEITVTPLGEEIVRQAQIVLEEAAAIKEIAKRGKDPLSGPLRVGVIYTIGPYLLPNLVRQMIADASGMPLILQESFTIKLLESLRQGDLDVAILADPFPDQGLMTQAVYDESFVIAVPRGHPWARREAIGATELKSETMLLLGTGHC